MRSRFARLMLTGMLCVATVSLLAAQGGSKNPTLLTIAKNGQVLRSTSTKAIFWGSQWSDPQFAGDRITGLSTFFDGFGGSDLAGLASEYFDRNGQITTASTFLGAVVNSSAPPVGTPSPTELVNAACSVTGSNPDPDSVYFIYLQTSQSNEICGGQVWGTCGRRAPMQVAFVHHTTGEVGSCGHEGLQGYGALTGHSASLDAMAKMTANLLMKTMTNPRGTGWLDAAGKDIGNKCEQVFPPDGVLQQLSNGSLWRLRGYWSNAAYLAGTGLPNSAGQRGCVY